MDEATYAQMPETLVLREIRFNIVEPGRRTKTIDLITTLTDAEGICTIKKETARRSSGTTTTTVSSVDIERHHIETTLKSTEWNKSKSPKSLASNARR